MKKLLYQFDTDPLPAVFDNVVGYDGGADHITAYGGVGAGNMGGLVEGAIFTRSPKNKKNTAIFIGGGNMIEGQALLAAVQKKFFGNFRVSVMFDCNGSNTTAAAAVAWLAHGRSLQGKRAVVLGGTGPVGWAQSGSEAGTGPSGWDEPVREGGSGPGDWTGSGAWPEADTAAELGTGTVTHGEDLDPDPGSEPGPGPEPLPGPGLGGPGR